MLCTFVAVILLIFYQGQRTNFVSAFVLCYFYFRWSIHYVHFLVFVFYDHNITFSCCGPQLIILVSDRSCFPFVSLISMPDSFGWRVCVWV